MNVTELKAVLDGALEAGLHPTTEVVVATDGWYTVLESVEHPVEDGRWGTDRQLMWVTLYQGQDADSRFTPGHEWRPDPTLFSDYESDQSEFTDPESGLYDPEYERQSYTEWLQDRYEGLAGALRDDPPKNRGELADDYRVLSTLLRELERMDP